MNVALIDSGEELAAWCARIDSAGVVALDTEFHNERSYAPRLMVIQFAVDGAVALVDALRIADLTPLARALASKEIVGHALVGDLRIFVDRFDMLPRAAFDTQLAAAFLGYGISISLADLVHDMVGVRLRKAQTVSDWSARPLSPAQIDYLVSDVAHLLPMRERLIARLEARGREAWYAEEARELTDPARYRSDPERLYLRLPGAARMNRRELGILRELAVLRDRLARERDVPPKYIIPDDAMGTLVHLRPRSFVDLAQLRRLDVGARKAYGEQILAAVARGLALDDADLPQKPSRPPSQDREAIVTCLSVLTSAIAREQGVPSSLLAPRGTLERVARELPATEEALASTLDGSAWRTELLVQPLYDLLHGKTALAVHGAERGMPRVARVPLPE
ncbi:MAG: ribonuclease D [Candidatus Eremiobacteraeota bacterium]|nr:ribonuclease D [Candidatus Eremiobacteraeota bacterium]